MSRQKFMTPCDPRLFEYFPEDVSDEEVFEDLAMLGICPAFNDSEAPSSGNRMVVASLP